jgi:hypothetical protein
MRAVFLSGFMAISVYELYKLFFLCGFQVHRAALTATVVTIIATAITITSK